MTPSDQSLEAPRSDTSRGLPLQPGEGQGAGGASKEQAWPAAPSTAVEPRRQHWVWVFGEIQGLRWVLERRVMAFADHAAPRVRTMSAGDLACLYVSRGAFHNPTRDQARLAGLVEVNGTPDAGKPVVIAGRAFSLFVGFKPIHLLPERQGPAVLDLVRDLELVKRPEVWGQYFRTSPIKAGARDYARLRSAVLAWREASS